MISLVDHHEQQFAVITADITTEIGKLKQQPSGGIQHSVLTSKQNLERLFEEANDTLEQIDLEARQMPEQAVKNKYQNRLKAYRTELQRLDSDYKAALQSPAQNSSSGAFFGGDEYDHYTAGDQRATLLTGNSRVKDQNNKLLYGNRVVSFTNLVFFS